MVKQAAAELQFFRLASLSTPITTEKHIFKMAQKATHNKRTDAWVKPQNNFPQSLIPFTSFQ